VVHGLGMLLGALPFRNNIHCFVEIVKQQ